MYGSLLIFTMHTGKDRTRSSAMSKALFGQMTSSHGRKYIYRRKGFLDDFPYVKLARGIIIVRKDDAEKIIEFTSALGANVVERVVVLTTEDVKRLIESNHV